MFTVNIVLLCFFLIKMLLNAKVRGDGFYLYLKCAITSLLGIAYFFLMAKLSGFIMFYNGGELYKGNTPSLNAVMIVVAVGYFALVIQPVLKIAFIKRGQLLGKLK